MVLAHPHILKGTVRRIFRALLRAQSMGLLVCPLIDCLCLESFSRICSKAPLGMMVQKLVGTLASPRKWPELPCTMGPQLVLFDFPLLNSFPTMSYSKKMILPCAMGPRLSYSILRY